MKNRTGIDFSKHEHRVEVYKCKDKEVRIDHFQVGNSNTNYLQFINTDRVLTVTGDFGNWVFCRPFVPSKDGFVSDGYWLEKLRISSEQNLERLDLDSIQTEIESLIKTGLEDYGYEDNNLKKAKDWFSELLENSDDELDYFHFAYRSYEKPDFIDFEMIPNTKKIPIWLKIIFDAFDEMCNRIKTNNKK